MNLGQQLDALKESLKTPSVYYKAPEDQTQINPVGYPFGAQPPAMSGDINPVGYPFGQQPAMDFGQPADVAGMMAPGGMFGGSMLTPDTGDTYGGMMGSTPVDPNFSPQVPGLDTGLEELVRSIRAQGANVPPMQAQAKPLGTWEIAGPAIVGGIAALLGGHNDQGRTAAAGMGFQNQAYGAEKAQHQQEADRLNQKNAYDYFVKKGTLDADAKIADLRYRAASGDAAAKRELEGKLKVIETEQAGRERLQAQKDTAAIAKFDREMKALPEKSKAKYMGIYEAGLAQGLTKEQASSYAMSEFFKNRASGELDAEKTIDIQKTREARIDAITAGAEVDRSRAALYDKEYDNFDTTQAIKLAILAAQMDSLGLKMKGTEFNNDPSKLEYDQLSKDWAQHDKNIKEAQKSVSEAAAVLNDIVKSATISPEEKARLQKQKSDGEAKVKTEKEEMDIIEARQKILSRKVRDRVSSPSSFGRLPPIPGQNPQNGYAPLGGLEIVPGEKLKLPGDIKAQSVSGVLDQLGL